ncbi:MAG: HAD family hydrolase [Chthoniobacterales bacterium]|nr:HAD family hydrolase [Chthoniobacterales bacterium]
MTTSPKGIKAAAVFVDRDGTIMRDVEYCSDPQKVEIFAGAIAALRRLKDAGFKIVMITNQSGIGRGYFTEAQYRKVEQEVARQLGPGVIDATYFCPDVPGVASTRRKPEPAMIFDAASDHDLDLSRSYFIGDKRIDAECGRNAGVRTILVQTGCETHQPGGIADWVARNLGEAAEIIRRDGV